MDSDHSSSASPAGNIHNCLCGKRVSSINCDFHSVCVACRGIDCDIDKCSNECTDVDDISMTKYVKHKLSLKRRLLCKCKLKDLLLSGTVGVDSAVIADAPSLAEQPAFHDPLSVSSDTAELDDIVDAKLSGIKSELVGQVCSLLDYFRKFLGYIRNLARLYQVVLPVLTLIIVLLVIPFMSVRMLLTVFYSSLPSSCTF